MRRYRNFALSLLTISTTLLVSCSSQPANTAVNNPTTASVSVEEAVNATLEARVQETAVAEGVRQVEQTQFAISVEQTQQANQTVEAQRALDATATAIADATRQAGVATSYAETQTAIPLQTATALAESGFRQRIQNNEEFFSVAWSPDGEYIAGGTKNGVSLWRISDGSTLGELGGYIYRPATYVQWTLDGREVFAATESGWGVYRWNVESGQELESWQGPACTRAVNPCVNDRIPGTDTFISLYTYRNNAGSNEAYALIYPFANAKKNSDGRGEPSSSFFLAEGRSFTAVAVSPDAQIVATGDSTGRVGIWNLADGTPIKTLRGDDDNAAYALAWSADGETLAGYSGRKIWFWDVAGERLVKTIEMDEQDFQDWHVIRWRPNSNQMAVINSGKVYLYNTESGEFVRDISIDQGDRIRDIAWNPDGKSIATVSERGVLTIWDVP